MCGPADAPNVTVMNLHANLHAAIPPVGAPGRLHRAGRGQGRRGPEGLLREARAPAVDLAIVDVRMPSTLSNM